MADETRYSFNGDGASETVGSLPPDSASPSSGFKKGVETNGEAVEDPTATGEDPDPKDAAVELERTKKAEAPVQTVSMLKLFGFADWLDRTLIVLGTLGAMATGAGQPLMTVLFGQLINSFGQNTSDTHRLVHAVSSVAIRFVYVGLGTAVAAYFEVACWMIAGERQAARIRSRYLRAILRQDVAYFDIESSTGEIITRMSGDTLLIQEALGEKVGKFIQLFATFVGGYIVAFIKSWKLTLVMMSIMPVMVFLGSTVATFVSRMSNRSQEAYAGAGSLVEQVISSIRTVASYTGEKKAVEDYDKNLKGAEKAGIWQGIATGAGVGSLIGFMFAGYSLALWYGGTLALHDGLSGGHVINVIFAVLTGAMAMGQASPSLGAVAAGRAAAYNIFEVIKRNPEIDAYDKSGLVPSNLKGDVELRKVDFRYPSRPDVLVFSKFSLFIPAGKTVALVGESGSGKSTVVSLIERFYDPESGEVMVDGLDIKKIQLKWLREQIGLVSQEPVLFSASIKENIAYGKENATMEEIGKASALANAAKFISRLPQGHETLVGERGIQLSGGQKQRVAIARAILKNPRILLLDEATSALDSQSERVVQDALDRVMTDRTTVVVAHRLTTIRNADMIAVVQRGAIVETGKHDELIHKPDGAYAQLVLLQEVHKSTEADPIEDPDHVPEPEDHAILARESGLQGSTRRSGSWRIGSWRSGSFRTSFTGGGLSFNMGSGRRTSRTSGVQLPGDEGQPRKSWTGDPPQDEAEDEKMKLKATSLMRLAKLNAPEFPLFFLGTAAACISGLVFPIFGLLISNVVAAFFEPPRKLRKDVNFWSLMFLVLALGVGFATPVNLGTFAYIGQKLIRRVRRLTFEKVVCQEISWFDEEENSSGAISSRLSADAAAVRSLVGDALALLVQNIVTLTTGVIIAFTACWQLAFIILALVPLLGVQGYTQMKWLRGFSEDAKVKYEEATRVANDAVSSVRTVASFCAEEKVCHLYDEKCKPPVRNGIRQGLVAGFALGFSNLVMFSTFALCFWIGSKLVNNGTATFKEVFRVVFALSMSITGVTQSAGLAPDFTKVKIAVNSIFAVVDRKSKIDPSDMSGETLKNMQGSIEFKKVSFFYHSRPDVQIFQNLSFVVNPGQTFALVGESGSGKSTVISLLERFYDPQSGVILVDGVDIQKLQVKWLRQQIGLVSQEPVLFDENVDWNICYGHEGKVSESEIQEAAKAANAHKFISALPDSYKTRVGERGTQLSGGQKQRVAIARAILKNPKILLLDEATSALDAESEHVVQEALDRIMENRTTIVIAHRLSTVRYADVIAVVKDGGIVERGKHEELIAKDGAYASLVKLHLTSA